MSTKELLIRHLAHIAALLVKINEELMETWATVVDPRVSGVKWGDYGGEDVSDYDTCLRRGDGSVLDFAASLAAFYNYDRGSEIAKVVFAERPLPDQKGVLFIPTVVSVATGECLWSPNEEQLPS